MKKLIFSLSALAALLLAGSCQRENLEPVQQGNTVTYTVQVPGALATKAANGFELLYEVYRQDNTLVYESDAPIAFDHEGKVQLSLEFVKDQTFTVLFWAQNSGCTAYNVGDLRSVTLADNLKANDENAEAFAGKDVVTNCVSAAENGNVVLVRPIAQINIATLNESLSLGVQGSTTSPVNPQFSEISVDGLYNSYNVATGEVLGNAAEVNFSKTQILPDADDTDLYKPVGMSYVGFMPKAGDNVVVDFKIYTEKDGEITHTVSNVPVKANYKTNIIGNLITATDNYQVTLGAWATEEKNLLVVDSATGLKEAIDNAKEGEEITLTGDIDLSELFPVTKAAAALPIVIAEGKSVVLNLNGYKITTPFVAGSTTNHTYAFENHGVLTIKDTKGEGEIVARGIFNYGKMTLESGTIKACDGNGGYGVRNYEGAEFVMNGGTVATIYEDGDIPGEGYDASPIRVDEGAKAVINGGIIDNVSNYTVAIDNYGETIINAGTFTTIHTTLANSATMTINGGSFTCNGLEGVTAHALWAAAGTTTINGGTFNGKDNYNGFNVDASKGATVYIKGGEFLPVHSGSLYGEGTIVVTGGTFFDNPSTRLDNAYEVKEQDGKFVVVAKPAVAKIGEVGYWSLNAAVAAVEEGGTITLIANETFTKANRYNNGGYWDGLGYSGDKSFTIDLGGYTISQDGALNDYLVWIKNVGSKENTITFKNGTMDAGKTAYCALCTASSHENKLTVNLEDITLINDNSNGSTVKIRTGSELNVKAGTKIIGKNSYLGIENWKADVNIYDGAEIYMNGTASYNGCLVGVGGNGTVNVYGGYGKGVSGGLIAMTSGGTINAMGGEWIANTDGTFANSNKSVLVAQSDKQYNAGAGNAVVNVTGGTYKGGYNCYGNAVGDAQINIKGGNFNADPETYVVKGYEAKEENGIYVVSKKPEATVNGTSYGTLAEAVAAAKAGETVTVIDDVTLSSELALPAGIIFNGNGKQINGSIYACAEGNLTFAGHTKVTSFSASYYNRTITIGEGACLEVTGGERVSLAYGNTFNITGSIKNAKTADKANVQPSLIIPSGISITGGNDAAMNVTNAYVKIGSTTSKPGVANGKFALNFNNSIAEFTNEFGFYEPTGGKNPTFEMSITNSVFTTGAKLCVAAANSTITVNNSNVLLGTYLRNSGALNITNGSVLTGKTIQFGENGGNNGTINVDASTLTIVAGSTGHAFDGKGNGKITVKNNATVSVDYYKAMTIEVDETSTFTGTEVK